MRRRIVILAVMSATLATSLFGIPLAVAAAYYFLTRESTELEHAADTAALDVAADLVHSRRPGQLLVPANGASLALYSSDGRLVGGQGPSSADQIVRVTLADNTIHHESGFGTMVAVVPIPDQAGGNYAVRASTPASDVYPKIALTWLGMLGLEVVILTLTWQLARWQARRLARPVERLAASASRLADGDFTVRAEPSGIREIDTAATALNHAAARIGELIDRERAVTAHASHQLRTPLAGLRLCLENVLESNGADYRTATREAVAAADRLESTIDDLVMLARIHDRRTQQPDIAALLNEVEATWHGLLAESGRSLRIITDPQLRPPRSSTAAIRQILAVLIDNAARHGTGTVTIHARETIDTVAIDVSDEGTAPSADDEMFDRSPADGHGIGLRLARSLAEAENGRLVLTSHAPTTVTLFLPEDHQERADVVAQEH